MVRMTCRRFRLLTSLRLDSELSGCEVELIGSHALRCGACRAYAEEVDAITAHIRATRTSWRSGAIHVLASL